MRHLLDKAIVHLLNEEQEQFERLIHEFMVHRGRQFHEKLRQGDDISLTEGWDDEIKAESYFTEADLDDVEDEAGDDVAAADELEADMDVDGGAAEVADMGSDEADDFGDVDVDDDVDAVDPTDEGDGDVEANVDERLDDIEDQIAKLTAEFEKAMAEQGDADADEGDMAMDGMGGDDVAADDVADMGGDEVAADDEMEPAGDDTMDDMGDEAADEGDEEDEDESKMDESYSDITESVLADLERVVLSMDDGKETDGSAIEGRNTTSPVPHKSGNARVAGEPVRVKDTPHRGFEREPAPASKSVGTKKNNKASGKEFLSTVPAPSNTEGTETGGRKATVNTVSPVAPRK